MILHEDADAGEALPCERFVGLLDSHDSAMSLLRADTLGITEKMAGQPEHEQEGQGREPEPQEGEQERAERDEGEEGAPFPAYAGLGMFHEHGSRGRPPCAGREASRSQATRVTDTKCPSRAVSGCRRRHSGPVFQGIFRP